MKSNLLIVLLSLLTMTALTAQSVKKLSQPIVTPDVVFEEVNGMAAVEAEFFYQQTNTEKRAWYRTSKNETPVFDADADPAHVAGAGNNAYLEMLPDTRQTHADPLVTGESFSNNPDEHAIGVLHYKIHFNTAGRYYVWVRAHSTGSEDNGIHVGIDGTWPATGQRLQWCEGKQTWHWESKQRTHEVHCGEPHLIYLDVEAGMHDIMFCMREDGFEFDKWFMTLNREMARPADAGPEVRIKTGSVPEPYPAVEKTDFATVDGVHYMRAVGFPVDGTHFYLNDNWLAINPEVHKAAETRAPFPFESGAYDLVFYGVGENDGQSEFRILKNDEVIGDVKLPLSNQMFKEGRRFNKCFEGVEIAAGDAIVVQAKIGSADGQEYSRGRWAGLAFAPAEKSQVLLNAKFTALAGTAASPPKEASKKVQKPVDFKKHFSDPAVRGKHGGGNVEISGELRQWHKVTLTIDGPFAHELDEAPNPFTDYRMTVVFKHQQSGETLTVPGYFAADGNAANSSADCGTKWRAHLSPPKKGKWTYKVSFVKGKGVAICDNAGDPMAAYDGKTGEFKIRHSDKKAPDMRARGLLEYVGEHYLKFAGSGDYFIKCGADAPENLLAYSDFDGFFDEDGIKDDLVKTWEPHVQDWQDGDPAWQDGKGRGLIGAVNYLASEGMNAFSFLPMNIEGDDCNVFPYIHYDARFNLDVSRLDQWEIVFAHGTKMGMFLHFKTMETENELLLDNGDLGPERKLYYRELIARFAHHPALNWNLGEEINDATTAQKKAWADYFRNADPYHHHIVIHNMGQPHYDLLGSDFALTGFSLQTSKPDFHQVHDRTLDYINRSKAAGKPWAVACDEPGDASHALITDDEDPDHRDARVNGLWGCLTAGGWGTEWYFGYKHPHSDLSCQDWRSRDLFWDMGRHAVHFFTQNDLPLTEMANADSLVDGDGYCFAKTGGPYIVMLKTGGTLQLNLSGISGEFDAAWFNPRTGEYVKGDKVRAGERVELGPAPAEADLDWVVLLTEKKENFILRLIPFM